MIPAQAVEAAYEAWLAHKATRNPDNAKEAIRAALEAAAPYMQPTVTTIEELDALPAGTVILDSEGNSTQAVMHGHGKTHWRDNKYRALLTSDLIALPATILHRPDDAR